MLFVTVYIPVQSVNAAEAQSADNADIYVFQDVLWRKMKQKETPYLLKIEGQGSWSVEDTFLSYSKIYNCKKFTKKNYKIMQYIHIQRDWL